MSNTAAPEASVKLLLKAEDQLSRNLQELERGELEQLRAAVDSTLARRAAVERERIGPARDHGFSCEWWPPD